jgi:PadR family transcriptional regulator PadR
LDSPPPPTSPRELRPQSELVIAWTLLVLHERGETHGYTLHRELLAHGLDVQATSVYRRLAKFERDGWVASRWAESVDGPQRHVYALTAQGSVALRELTGLIVELRDCYDRFSAAHALTLARRGAAGVEAAAPTDLRAPPTHEVPDGSPSHGSLRPHKELLAGWLLLHLDAGATYGYDLQRAFHAQRLSPDAGALYRMLRRLEADKWVQSRWLRPAAGPSRRLYRLTSRGRRNLDEIALLIELIGYAHDRYLKAYERAWGAA